MDFEQARFNMVEQQIRPWDVLNFDVLDAMESIPREEFVLPEQQGYAYADLPLVLANGHFMLEPKVVARLVQGLSLNKNDKVLEIGTGSGYATAVLAVLSGQVHTVDNDEKQLDFARKVLAKLNFLNITYEVGDGLTQNHTKETNDSEFSEYYDAIYVGGGLSVLPENLLQRLSPNGGRLVAIVGQAPVQQCILTVRDGDDFKEKVLFDTLVKGLNETNLPKTKLFVF